MIGGATVATTDFLRLFLVLGCLSGLVLALLGAGAGTRRDAPAVMLGTLAAAALALSLPDARIAVPAATIGGLLGVLVTLVPTGARVGATVGIREVRAVIIAGALAIGAAAWIARPLGDLAVQPEVFGLAYLCFTIAVAIRFGVIPFHFWAARLADAAPEVTLPVLTAWGPAVLAVVALAWIDGAVAPVLPEVGAERAVLIGIGVVTIVLATFAAWIQDDLEHVLGYSIMGDAGVIILGLAALGTEAWTPVRVWILAFVVARSAFAAWCAATRATFWTGRLDDLRGWARHSPPLVVALVLVIVASVGLPGFAAWDARSTIVRLLFGAPWAAPAARRAARPDPLLRAAARDRPPSPARRVVGGGLAAIMARGRPEPGPDVGRDDRARQSRREHGCPRAAARPARGRHVGRGVRRDRSGGRRGPRESRPWRSKPAGADAGAGRPIPRERAPNDRRRARTRAAPPASNHSWSSEAAVSVLSDAWTMFCAVSSAKSPRIVPGAASCGRVAPLIARTTAMAFGPSRASATSGPDVMKSTSPLKNGFSRWTA